MFGQVYVIMYHKQMTETVHSVEVEVVEQEAAGVEFPLDHLARLDEQLGRPKWVVPVRHDDDLERLLRVSIHLCKQGKYVWKVASLKQQLVWHI